MGRGKIRECIRRAQAAEVAGELDEAVRQLADAARLHVQRNEESRAAVLVRHGLRLKPESQELLELLERVKGSEQAELIPDEPLKVVEVSDPQVPPAVSPERIPDEPLKVVELEGVEQAALPGARGLEVPQRGPTLADPGADHWCSFCCRPKTEAGAMVAGPVGAYMCAQCLEVSARLLGAGEKGGAGEKHGAKPATRLAGSGAPEVAPDAAMPASASAGRPEPQRELDFIEAAVVLSKKLGWGLSELRSLGPEELRKAMKKLEELGDG